MKNPAELATEPEREVGGSFKCHPVQFLLILDIFPMDRHSRSQSGI